MFDHNFRKAQVPLCYRYRKLHRYMRSFLSQTHLRQLPLRVTTPLQVTLEVQALVCATLGEAYSVQAQTFSCKSEDESQD